jgi:2'-5' RNA ligase
MPRLFIAVDLAPELRQEIAAMCTGVRDARWAKPHQLHITLRFLGDVADDAVPDVHRRLAQVKVPDFHLCLRGVGVFPEARTGQRPRVLWLGIEPTDRLAELKRAIDRALGVDGKASKREAFSPHLTLARFSKTIEKRTLEGSFESPAGERRRAKPACAHATDSTLLDMLAQHRGYRSATWHVTCFKLYQSSLHSSGSVHTSIQAYQLAPDESGG